MGKNGRIMSTIRVIAIAVVQKGTEILVAQGWDDHLKSHFYRPLGGAIEFGETAEEAVKREFLEELSEEVQNVRSLGVLENIYEWNNQPWHEIVFVFTADFVNDTLYQRNHITYLEDDRSAHVAMWKSLDSFDDTQHRLVPLGLMELLQDARD